MRPIGNLPDEAQARVFGDFLLAQGIKNDVEPDAGNAWCVWVMDEDRIEDAQEWLRKFLADPHAVEFRKAAAAAPKIRKAEARDLAEYQRRVRTRKSLFPSFGGYGVGFVTYTLIIICAIVAIYSKLGENDDLLNQLFISNPRNADGGFLPEVFKNGEVWRLLTPIFIHFGFLHFLFNMMWLYQLGCMIEGRKGSLLLLGIVVATGILSNVAQYIASGPKGGGMSGVVYALAGFAWMRGKFDRSSGVHLDSQSVTILLIWLVVCFTGYLGNIGNAAHVSGLICGMIWGFISAWFATRRPE